MIGVVILNWNGRKLLAEFLPQVLANTDPALATVIVADNGSTDGSVDYLRDEFPQVARICFDHNLGFAGGYNEAISLLADKYEYIVLLNSDAAPAPGWIAPLHQFMSTHPEYGACQPKLLAYKQKDTFEYAGACGGFLDKNGYPYCRGRVMQTLEKDHGQYDDIVDIFWATGAALMVRTQAYQQAGGLDTAFFAHMEEIDLCWRLWRLGWKIAVVPQAVVYHLGGASLPVGNPRKTYLNFRNSLLMLHKNLPASQRRRKLLIRRLLDTLAWAKFMATAHWGDANAILRAHRDFRKMRNTLTATPSASADRQPLTPPEGNISNLITAYYLKGRRHFC